MSDEFLARRCRVLNVRYTSTVSDVKFTSDDGVSIYRDCIITQDGKHIDKLIDGDILKYEDDIDTLGYRSGFDGIYYGGRIYEQYRTCFPEFPPKFFSGIVTNVDIDVSKLNIDNMIIKMTDIPQVDGRYTYMPRYFAYGSFIYDNHQFTICFKSFEFPFLTADDIMRLVKDNNHCKYYCEEGNDERTITCNIRSERYCDVKLQLIYTDILFVTNEYIDGGKKDYAVHLM